MSDVPGWGALLRRAWYALWLWRTPAAPACEHCGFPMALRENADPCRPIRWRCNDCDQLHADYPKWEEGRADAMRMLAESFDRPLGAPIQVAPNYCLPVEYEPGQIFIHSGSLAQ